MLTNEIDENAFDQFRIIEEIINEIRNIGRNKYKEAVKESNTDRGFIFKFFNHMDSSAEGNDGFNNWKVRLEELLI